jgi:arylsulfatase A-like enzyme
MQATSSRERRRLASGAVAFAWLLAWGLAGSLVAGCGVEGSAPARPPERIILIVVDTLRRDHVSAYGSPVATPNIDRLAREAQVFENAVSAFHSTTMSMAALFAGRTPSIESATPGRALEWNTFASCGMSRFAEPGGVERCVPRTVDTIAEDLKGAGYYTIGVVSNKLLFRPYGYEQGFDDWVEVGRGRPGVPLDAGQAARIRTAPHVNAAVVKALERRTSDRFFLYVHYIDVHDWILFGLSYEEGVRRFDVHLGQLLDYLESRGLLEGAAIVFTSDHGEMLVDHHLRFETTRHYGNPSFEPLLQVPLFVTPPTAIDSSTLVRTQDVRGIIRTIAGLEGGPTPDLEPDEHYVTEQFYQTYRRGRWKSMWDRKSDAVLLFDLESDPGELRDLSAERPDVLAEHRARIDVLSRSLATAGDAGQSLDEEDLERLRALGYVDDAEGPPPSP